MDDSVGADTKSQVLQTTLAEINARANTDPNHGADDCCVICLDRITEKAQATPCRHSTFDFLCLASWLQQRSSCPLCNAEVAAIHYDFTDKTYHKVYKVTSTKKLSNSPSNPVRTPQTTYYRPTRPRRNYTYHPPPTFDDALTRRKAIYTQNLYSLHVGSNRISRFRDFTPQSISASPELQSRARAWIRRELRVFAFLSPDAERPADRPRRRGADNAEFLLEYIVAILKTVDVQGPVGQAEEMLAEFLGREHARLFLHELRAWLRSPYARVEDWDRNVQYGVSGKVGGGIQGGNEEGRGRGRGRREHDRYTPYGDRGRRGGGEYDRYTPYRGSGRRSIEEARRRHNPD